MASPRNSHVSQSDLSDTDASAEVVGGCGDDLDVRRKSGQQRVVVANSLMENTSRLFTPLTPSINILVTSPVTTVGLSDYSVGTSGSGVCGVDGSDAVGMTDSSLIQYNDVCWIRGSGMKCLVGKIILSTYKLSFVYGSKGNSDESDLCFSLPYGCISRIEKMGGQSTSANLGYGVEVFCKDIRHICLSMKKMDRVRKQFFNDLYFRTFWINKGSSVSGLGTPWPPYAAEYLDHFVSTTPGGRSAVQEGWNIYRKVAEFDRMKIPYETSSSSNGRPWVIEKTINENYEFCSTYPNVLVIPASFKPANRLRAGALLNSDSSGMDEWVGEGGLGGVCQLSLEDSSLWRVREYRSKHRIPVLSWYNAQNHAALIRSAQPMSGIGGSSVHSTECVFDRNYLKALAACNPSQSQKLYIVDARPKVNAMANMAKGGGYEDYPEHDFEFLNIGNIHVMRESLRRLQDLLFPVVKDDRSFYKDLDSTEWLWHIRQLMLGAYKVAFCIDRKATSVLVHCSDGWDRTSQLTSLAMLMLDGYYRTLEGFMVLIEKEWVSFGHKFATRIGHGEDKYGDSDRSPIFVQFIDAVHQFEQQFPNAFEFNEHFLITLLDHLYSCRFGNFLCNSERERHLLRITSNTVSLWSFILRNRAEFLNPFYSEDHNKSTLYLIPSMRYLRLWKNYYCRYGFNFVSTLDQQVKKFAQIERAKVRIRAEIDKLKKEIANIENDHDLNPKSADLDHLDVVFRNSNDSADNKNSRIPQNEHKHHL